MANPHYIIFILYFITCLFFLFSYIYIYEYIYINEEERASDKLAYNKIYIMNIYTLYTYLYAHYI